jgi:hypothetical protein
MRPKTADFWGKNEAFLAQFLLFLGHADDVFEKLFRGSADT